MSEMYQEIANETVWRKIEESVGVDIGFGAGYMFLCPRHAIEWLEKHTDWAHIIVYGPEDLEDLDAECRECRYELAELKDFKDFLAGYTQLQKIAKELRAYSAFNGLTEQQAREVEKLIESARDEAQALGFGLHVHEALQLYLVPAGWGTETAGKRYKEGIPITVDF